jgi:hypothetical protein
VPSLCVYGSLSVGVCSSVCSAGLLDSVRCSTCSGLCMVRLTITAESLFETLEFGSSEAGRLPSRNYHYHHDHQLWWWW